MNQRISNFQGYPPRVMIHLGNENPEPWTLRLAGLTEEVVFTVTSAIQVGSETFISHIIIVKEHPLVIIIYH